MNLLNIMSPFIFIIKSIFLFAYDITGNYGISIILLSFSISLLLLPIFILIEKSKKKDNEIKQKMKPLIDEIKRVYKGQERYYYIKTIHRQHNYNSYKALVPILSLLIQIPFFIAAYQFLENFEALKNVSFLFIKDLSLPDSVLGSINILPVIMTIINLITAYFYTKNNDDTSELKQMLVIAIAFLILLFNLPAGLVLYWTMNNFFSFLRLFITNPEVFEKEKQESRKPLKETIKTNLKFIKQTFYILSIILISTQIYWAVNHDFKDIITRILLSILLSFALTVIFLILHINQNKISNIFRKINIDYKIFFSSIFLSVYFYFASILYYENENNQLLLLALLSIIFAQTYAYSIKLRTNKGNTINKLILTIQNIFLVAQFLNIAALISGEIKINIFNILITPSSDLYIKGIVSSGIMYSLSSALIVLNNKKIQIIKNKHNLLIYILAIVYLSGFVFLWNPLNIYSSFPDNFIFPAIEILKHNIYNFIITLLILSLIYIISPTKLKYILTVFILIITSIAFIHNTILPINMGSLQENKYLLSSNLAQPIIRYIAEALLFLLLYFLFSNFYTNKKRNIIITALIILNILSVSEGIYAAINTGRFFKLNNDKLSEEIKQSNKISFSKDKENIIFFISDMFHGWYMNKILKDNPELKEIFSGFNWYPNTCSVSSITCGSMPAIIGGFNYTIDKLNKDTIHNMEDKMTVITKDFFHKIKDKGYRFTSTNMIYSKINKYKFDSYLPAWDKDWNKFNYELRIGESTEMFYTLLWENALFYSSPLLLKPKIYNKGKWINHSDDTKSLRKNTNAAKRYNFLRLLPKISDTKSKTKSFIYIHSMASHHPWDYVDDEGLIHEDVGPYENNKWVINTLAKWIKWMKKNNVYNNTKIVLLSDHGIHWGHFKGKMDTTLPIKNIQRMKSLNLNEGTLKGLFPLLLVKDFNSKGKLKQNMKFMSNADASYIALNKEPFFKEKNRSLPSVIVYWKRKIGKKHKLNIVSNLKIKENVYDINNWTKNTDNITDSAIFHLFKKYSTEPELTLEQKKLELRYQIMANEKWMENVKHQADEKGISVDSMITRTVNYIIRNKK